MRNNKKGFTLVELLAVIVILAVVMLIAVTSVGPMMEKSRKGALGTEGVAMVDAAKSAFSAEQMNSNSPIKATSSVCFDYAFLSDKNYLEGKEGYSGSVLVTRTSGAYKYEFYITNGTYTFGATSDTALAGTGLDPNSYNADDAVDYKEIRDAFISAAGSAGINTCNKTLKNNAKGEASVAEIVYCTATVADGKITASTAECRDAAAKDAS